MEEKKEKPHVNVGTIGMVDHGLRQTGRPSFSLLQAAALIGAYVPGPDLYSSREKTRHMIITDSDQKRLDAAEAKRKRKAEKRRIEQEKRIAKTIK